MACYLASSELYVYLRQKARKYVIKAFLSSKNGQFVSSHKIYFRAPIIINQEHSLASGHIGNSLFNGFTRARIFKIFLSIFGSIFRFWKKCETSTHTAKSPIIPTNEIEQLDRSKLANIFDTRLDWDEKTHFAPIGIENWALKRKK